MRWLALLWEWITGRYFRKGMEAGKMQQRAEDAVEAAEHGRQHTAKIVKELKHNAAEAQQAEAEWKKRHGF